MGRYSTDSSGVKFIAASVLGVFLGVVGLTVLFGSWYTVDQTERGVRLRNGAVIGIAEPGLGFKTPWIESVVSVPVTVQTFTFDKMDTYSFDQQQAFLRVSITLHAVPDRVSDIYSKFGGLKGLMNAVVAPVVNQQVKIVFVRYTSIRAIQERGSLNTAMQTAIMESLKADSMIMVDSVQVEDVAFSEAYRQSIEQRMIAEVEVTRVRQNVEREKATADITVTKAKADADSTRARALAEADAIKARAEADAQAITVKGQAEATAIEARSKALGQNPNLVELVRAERWDGKLPSTMIPGAAVPMVNVGK